MRYCWCLCVHNMMDNIPFLLSPMEPYRAWHTWIHTVRLIDFCSPGIRKISHYLQIRFGLFSNLIISKLYILPYRLSILGLLGGSVGVSVGSLLGRGVCWGSRWEVRWKIRWDPLGGPLGVRVGVILGSNWTVVEQLILIFVKYVIYCAILIGNSDSSA